MKTVLRPHIVLVVFDSLSAAALDRHADILPTLTALRRESVTFSKAFAPSPAHGPARASLFTGLDMAAHGVWTDGVALPPREETLPEVFRRNGYTTSLVGRRHLAGVSSWTTEHARPHEYDHFDWAHGPLHRSRQNAYLLWLWEAAPERYAGIFPRQADPDDTAPCTAQRDAMLDLPDELSFNIWAATQVCARLSEQATEAPVFGIAGFVVGETLGGAPSDRGSCEGLDLQALQQADAGLKMILQAAPAETVFLVTAGCGCCEKAQTGTITDEAVNVPLMLRMSSRAAQEVSAIVSTMDIAPTLYEIAGLRPPVRMQGRSLLSESARGWALARMRQPGLPHQTALWTDRCKLVMSGAPPTYALYDRSVDPQATADLAGDPAHHNDLEDMIDLMIDARVALEDRTEPRIAHF